VHVPTALSSRLADKDKGPSKGLWRSVANHEAGCKAFTRYLAKWSFTLALAAVLSTFVYEQSRGLEQLR